MTLIEVARTMLADSKLSTTFLVDAVSTVCCVQNRVLVVKPHNKTPYKLFHGRTPTLSFMRPFGCPIIILNTIDHLGKFNGKADKGFFVGYSLNSKDFRVFNSRTRIVEENLHIRTINYDPVVASTQSNGFTCAKASDNAGQARKETKPESSHDDGSKPASDDGKSLILSKICLTGHSKGEYLKDLYKLVKAKYESTRPVEDLDLLLWGDLKSMFEPCVEDELDLVLLMNFKEKYAKYLLLTELVEGKEKRARTELIQEITKKQKVEDDKETAELKQFMEIILDEEEVAINSIPLSIKSLNIVD
nr:retrovirus-related Pol polyprotein from transposon TNT 1-94 [Tanacetum cinerariifolium]